MHSNLNFFLANYLENESDEHVKDMERLLFNYFFDFLTLIIVENYMYFY